MKIEWKYFFGGSYGRSFDRYYKANIKDIAVEKHESNKGVKYSIGNIDNAKEKYSTEEELIRIVLKNCSPSVARAGIF